MTNRLINRQSLLNLFFLCLLTYLTIQVLTSKPKITYIDANKVINGYKEIKLAKQEIQKNVELYKERMDTLTGHVKLDMLNMEKFRNTVQSKSYSDSAKYHKNQAYNYQQAMTQSLKEEEARLTAAALKKLNIFLKVYGERKGYDMILIANNSGTIAYAKDKYEISDEVLRELNK